jgi:hypothetical protein
MPQIGKYNCIRQVESGGKCSSFHESSGALVVRANAAKNHFFQGSGVEPSEFREAVEVQQTLSGKHRDSWLGVVDSSLDEEVQFCVYQEMPSLARLVDRKFRLESNGLKTLLLKLVVGIKRINSVSGRAHGNIKLTNIFLEGSGSIEKRNALLSDVATETDLRHRKAYYSNPDLRALGEIIYALAGRLSRIESTMFNVPAGEDWSSLFGRDADFWKGLCNELLNPKGSYQEGGLELLEKDLKKVGSKKLNGLPILIGIGAVVIIGFFGIRFLDSQSQENLPSGGYEQYQSYISEYDSWLKEFASKIVRNRKLFEDDVYLTTEIVAYIQDNLNQLSPDRLLGPYRFEEEERLSQLISEDLEVQRLIGGSDQFLGELKSRLAAWTTLSQLNQHLATFDANKWPHAATVADNRKSEFTFDSSLFESLRFTYETFLSYNARIEAWDAMRASGEPVYALEDLVLSDLQDYHKKRLGESDDFDNIQPDLLKLSAELEQLKKLVADPDFYAAYDYDLFTESIGLGEEVVSIDESLQLWIETVGGYRKTTHYGAEKRDQFLSEKKQVLENIDRLKTLGLISEANGFNDDTIELDSQFNQLLELPPIEKKRQIIQNETRQLLETVSYLNENVRSLWVSNNVDPDEWLAQKKSEGISVSGSLEKEWLERRDAFFAGRPASYYRDQFKLMEVNDLLDKIKNFLQKVDRFVAKREFDFGSFNPTISSRMDELVELKREGERQALVGIVPKNSSGFDWDFERFQETSEVVDVHSGVIEYLDTITQFGNDIGTIEASISQGDPLSEGMKEFNSTWASGDRSILREFQGISWVDDVLSSIGDLIGIGQTSDLGSLLAVVEDTSSSVSMLRTVWGQIRQLSDWPSNVLDLENATNKAEQLKTRGVLTASEFESDLKNFWKRAANSVSEREELYEVFKQQDELNGDFQEIDVRPRFDYIIWRNLESVDSEGPAEQKSKDEIIAQLDRLKGELTSGRADGDSRMGLIQSLQDDLARPDYEEPEADFNVSGLGETEGWELSSTDGSDLVSYTWNNYTIPFRRVVTDDGLIHFVQLSELSIGFALDWLNESNMWADLNSRLADTVDFSRRDGPSSWKSLSFALDSGAELAFDWISDPHPTWMGRIYDSSFNPSSPRPEHPIQYIPPAMAQYVAESLGCSLPSVSVFLKIAEERGAESGLNLRDPTWGKQYNYVNSKSAISDPLNVPWPDRGIFGMDQNEARGPAQIVVSVDDGFLWFREINSSNDSFNDIFGNVAEYYVDNESGSLFVAGGSALSPPSIDIYTPYEVDVIEAESGYSDVGFRLSFMVENMSPGFLFKRMLAAIPVSGGEVE